MKPNYASTPILKRKISSISSSISTPTQAPLVLYYPSKSEYEPAHESIPVYYGLLAEGAPRVYYEDPAADDIKKPSATSALKNSAEPEQSAMHT